MACPRVRGTARVDGTRPPRCVAHCGRGDEIIIGDAYHVFRYEAGGASVLGSAVYQILPVQPDGSIRAEDVAAAIVLREGGIATEPQIREFAANRLADFKVPRKIVFLDEIPKGATGKLQRIGLAEKLGLG